LDTLIYFFWICFVLGQAFGGIALRWDFALERWLCKIRRIMSECTKFPQNISRACLRVVKAEAIKPSTLDLQRKVPAI
jgi:hypothetical protein